MSELNKNNSNDAYDELLKNFSSVKKSDSYDDEPDVKNNGEIYFSANSEAARKGISFDKPVSGQSYAPRFDDSRNTVHKSPEAIVSRRRPQAYAAPQNTEHAGGTPFSAASRKYTENVSSVHADVPMSAKKKTQPAVRSAKTAKTEKTAKPEKKVKTPGTAKAENVRSDTNNSAVRRTKAAPTEKKPGTAKKSASKAGSKPNKSIFVNHKFSKENAADDIKALTHNSSFMLAMLVVVFVIVASVFIRIPVMGCINDVLAIDRDDTQIRVIVSENMDTDAIIDMLGKKDLIYSTGFCKLISGFLGYGKKDNIEYPAGTYYLSADMGVEGMLSEIVSAGAKDTTVSITFPEGLTIDKIVSKLVSNGVATSASLYNALDSEQLYTDYPFLSFITNKDARYRALEGYLYPDTYEFYIGENPISVFKRFLDNFNNKWTETYSKRAEELGMTVDEIITLASIIQKEASDAEQMPLVSSIIYNRLKSSSFPCINCDSTAFYIESVKDSLTEKNLYETYIKVYDTYQQTGLPVGPICNPGADAVDAALYPDSTDYYYFLHDKSGKIYVARTQSEHEANQKYMDS